MSAEDTAQPVGPEHHLALGTYLSAWGELEYAFDHLLGALLSCMARGADSDPGRAIGEAISTRAPFAMRTQIACDLLSYPLQNKDLPAAEMRSFFTKARDASTKRNRIVHAIWALTPGGEPRRIATNLDTWDVLDALRDRDGKTAKEAIHELEDIRAETSRIVALRMAGADLLQKIATDNLRRSLRSSRSRPE